MDDDVPRSIIDNHRPERPWICPKCFVIQHTLCWGGDCVCTCRSEFAPFVEEDA